MVNQIKRRGFTLIELMVVLAIVATLLTLSMPRYFQHVEVAKLRVLVENLRTTRDAIGKFYADTGSYPVSLQQLVDKKYLTSVPIDPVIDRSDAWIIVAPSGSGERGGVGDLKSAATGMAPSGVPFSEL